MSMSFEEKVQKEATYGAKRENRQSLPTPNRGITCEDWRKMVFDGGRPGGTWSFEQLFVEGYECMRLWNCWVYYGFGFITIYARRANEERWLCGCQHPNLYQYHDSVNHVLKQECPDCGFEATYGTD